MWKMLCLDRCIPFYTVIFISIWFAAWVLNAIHSLQFDFDLDRLRDIYAWLMTQLNATHAINSIWNSPKGCGPDKNASS